MSIVRNASLIISLNLIVNWWTIHCINCGYELGFKNAKDRARIMAEIKEENRFSSLIWGNSSKINDYKDVIEDKVVSPFISKPKSWMDFLKRL